VTYATELAPLRASSADDSADAPAGPLDPDPAELGRLAIRRAAAGVDQPTAPLYLRRPDAVPSAGAKRVG
jgi:tRNA threonylcarbamoyladenosine biosynthesis protein TsaB